MVSAKTLLNCPDRKITFTVHTDASDKQFGDVISQNDKPIDLLSRKLINPYINHTHMEKEPIFIVEDLNQSC